MNHLPLITRAVQHQQRKAIQSAGDSYTYCELLIESETLASALLDGEEDLQESRVAFLIPPGKDYVVSQWGIWRAGGVAVPLSMYATRSELEYVLNDTQSSIVIVSEDLEERVAGICQQHNLRLMRPVHEQTTGDAMLPRVESSRRAMILYTSGTTSKPKGVVSTHACVQAQIESLVDAWQWQADDSIPLFLPLHHIHGIINVLSCALWAGAQVDAFSRFQTDLILNRVAAGAYTVFMAVPTIYVKLIERLEEMDSPVRDNALRGFAQMRLMVSGSAALPASVHEKWTALTGRALLERYGMTEIGMALSNPYTGQRRAGMVGQPLPGVEIRLQDDAGELVLDEGHAGEIQVRGPSLFKEYWNRPDVTNASFQDRWFRTGDIALVEDGYYRILGRRSIDIIKSGGYKLSALEIEAALLDHPFIAQCAVVGLPDEKWGDTVAAATVLASGETLDINALEAWCKDRISPYKVPRKLLVVEQLPRNAMGKVEKRAVVQLFEANT